MRTFKLIVVTRFEVTTNSKGILYANPGDVLELSNKDAEHYNIHKVGDTRVFSRWIRKPWVNAKCNKSLNIN